MNNNSRMSGVIHRSQSHMEKSAGGVGASGDVSATSPSAFHSTSTNLRSSPQLTNGRQSQNPLHIFTTAKKNINDIFRDLDAQITESSVFFKRIGESGIIPVDQAMVDHVCQQYNKIKGITEMVARDHMKVVFFGRTSNGKSTVINAMLRDKVLPTGIGHTTSCFIQVEGTDEAEGYALKEGSDERLTVKSVANLSHALSDEHLKEGSLVRLLWPKNKCPLLRDDLVMVDSPGIDITPDTDIWIDKYCLDADVFVLVANSESTLMQTEKNFFHKVSQRLSKPNIFILMNRWDCAAHEPELMEEVRQQHLNRNLAFLTQELGVMSKEQAFQRMYFISAREQLMSQTRKSGEFAEGYAMRMQDFATFERAFQQCITKSAVRTKFEHHTQQGRNIAQEMRTLLECVYNRADNLRKEQDEERLRQESLFNLKTTHYEVLTVEFREKIESLARKAGQEIIAGFKEELARLPSTVNSYSKNWPVTTEQMEIYKQGLYETFERNFLRNLEARCCVPINNAVDAVDLEMLNRLGGLLPEASRDVKLAPLHRRARFNLKVHLSLPQLCCGFKEDLTFQFSLGWQRLARVILSRKELRRLTTFGFLPSATQQTTVTESESKSPIQSNSSQVITATASSSGTVESARVQNVDAVEIAAILSKCGVGTGAVLFMVYRSIGWRVIVGAVTAYALLYGAERLAWHFRTRRRVFKSQFVDYVRPQLHSLIHPTATNCTYQVKEELNFTYEQLVEMVSISTTELSDRIATLRREVKELDQVTSQAKTIKNKSVWLESQLQAFWEKYIANEDEDGEEEAAVGEVDVDSTVVRGV